MRHRSPIEMMVDKACGFDPNAPQPPRVTLRCPKCKKEKDAAMDQTDPPGTAVVLTQCPECVGGDFSTVDYFDKDGKEASAVQEGRLVLQDHWTLVLAPSDRRVLLAVPNVNVGPVTPA